MRNISALSIVVAVLAWSSAASAKDICVSDTATGGGSIVFRKVRALKAGKAISLTGIGTNAVATESFPVDGTAIVTSAGAVKIGVFYHSMDPALTGGNGLTASLTGDATFTATGKYDNTGDNVADGVVTWTPIDCGIVHTSVSSSAVPGADGAAPSTPTR